MCFLHPFTLGSGSSALLPHQILNGISNLNNLVLILILNSDQPDYKDALGDLVGSLPESMHPMITIDVAMLFRIKIRRIVKVLTLPLSHVEADIICDSETSRKIALSNGEYQDGQHSTSKILWVMS